MNSGDTKKTWLPLLGRPILAHTLDSFERTPSVDAVIVIVPASEIELCRAGIVEQYGFEKVRQIVAGGTERQDSVARGLEAAGSDWDVIVVHDGARPLVTPDIIERSVACAIEHGSAVAAMPVKDTIKEAIGGVVASTLPRERLFAVQTPQAFRTGLIMEAHTRAATDGFIGTDESVLVERMGEEVRLVEGSYENIKVTTPEDMAIAEVILSRRRA
jgi:2-C-methyl-D-erythritol 4-phosphate cytidylyltransferase